MKNQRAFILIELITVIILIGIIASFTGFFLYTGFKGYLTAKNNSEGALNAQMAMDRINLELRDLNYFTSFSQDSSITYTSSSPDLTGTRILKYDSNSHEILLNINNNDYPLVDKISSFRLRKIPQDLTNDGIDEVAAFEVVFNIGLDENRIGTQFEIKIYPRNMVEDK